jgi:MFS family permease
MTLQKMPRNVWGLGFVSLLTDVSSEMIYAVLPMFLLSLGAGPMALGAIEGLAEATAALVKVFSGALSDYLGQRKALTVAGYGLSALVKPLFLVASSPMLVLVARLADRVGKGVRGAPRDALIADSTPPELRGAAFGLRQSLDTVGAVLGPILAFACMAMSQQRFQLVFAVALIPAVLSVLLLILVVREPQRDRAGNQTGGPIRQPINWAALQSLGGPYWQLLCVALLFNLGNSSEVFLLLRAQQIGIAPAIIPLTLGVMNLTYALSAYPVGWLSDRAAGPRIGRVGLLCLSFLLYALTYLGFAAATAPWQIWALLMLYGLYLGLSQGTLTALVADRVPATLRGTAFGLLNLAIGAALLPASAIAGYLWQTVSPSAPFLLDSGLALLAAALLFGMKSQAHRREGD